VLAESRVDSYTLPLDAELAKAYLESHEIRVRLEGEALVGSAYALGPMLGGIRLFVSEQDEPRARALLDGYHHALRQRRALEEPSGTHAISSDASDAESDDDATDEETPDDLATRAWGSTLLAFVLLPVVMHVYAVALLLRVSPRELTPKARGRYMKAWVLNLAVFAVVGWVVAKALH
jgi:hypothetical protein